MNNIVPLKSSVELTAAQLKLAKHTVAKDANDDEFNLFIHTCQATGLDPLRKQAYLWIFNKDKTKFRRMVIVTSIGGYRSIAARTGNYRPNDDVPEFHYDEAAKHPSNPKGLVKAVETVWQRAHGEWFKVRAEARWDAYAPIIEEPEGGYRHEDTGETWPDGNPKKRKVPLGEIVRKLDPDKSRWRVDPEGMLAKCAEALALRKAWPDDFAGVNSEDEMDKQHSADKYLDLTATEIVNAVEAEEKLNLMGGKNALTVDWCDGKSLERVPEGKFLERALEWLRKPGRTADEVRHWSHRNLAARGEYKARHGGEYLEFQKLYDKLLSQLDAATPHVTASAAEKPVTEGASSPTSEPASPAILNAVETRMALSSLRQSIANCASMPELLELEKRWTQTNLKALSAEAQKTVLDLFDKAKE